MQQPTAPRRNRSPKAAATLALSCAVFTLATPAAPPVRDQVDVVLRILAIGGASPPALGPDAIHLTQSQKSLAFEFRPFTSPTAAPTYALVDLSHCPDLQTPSTSSLNEDLSRMFRLNWQVSVLRAAHTQTPFVASSGQLAGAHPVPNRTETEAITSLDQNAGRHLIFALCTTAKSLPFPIAATAEAAFAPLFTISPGSPVDTTEESPAQQVHIASNYQTIADFTSPGALTLKRLLPNGRPLNQPSTAAAVATAQKLDQQFFLLHIPSASLRTPLTLDVRIPDRSPHAYRIFAQAYTQGPRAPNVIVTK